LILGLGLLALLVVIRYLSPKLPSALMVVILGIVLVSMLNLESRGVVVLGNVPAGLPSLHFAMPTLDEFSSILTDGAAIALLSFISGVLTAKSFARRNRYEVDANQELIGFGASNIISGLAQGFPVTGADSRTAVNNAMGGKSQMVGLVAAAAMLLVLFFLTDPLAFVPKAALAAVITVAAIGLFDQKALVELYGTNRLELGISLVSMLGVLILGVLPGVGLAIGLSLAWLLYVVSNPPDAILGRIPGLKGWYSLKDNPEARTIPGILIFQFNANIVFFNADRFKARVLHAVAASETPVEWVVLDASPVNYIDVTGITKIDELREEMALRGVRFVTATARDHMGRYFDKSWVEKRKERFSGHRFPTINSAVKAFEESKRKGPM
jgi:MFS superfamily sulfate permease-like transporter